MNDEPTPDAGRDAGTPETLDDTQRIDVPRYSPAPDPRPDARWAWASPGSGPQDERGSQPGLTASGTQAGPGTSGPSAPPSGPAWGAPHTAASPGQAGYSVPVSPATSRRKRGPTGVGTVVTAS